MTLDVSLEAIEAELAIASRGGQVADLAVRRAQVLATLLAAQPAEHQGRHEAPERLAIGEGVTDIHIERSPFRDVFTVPTLATWADRVEAAAMLLRIDVAKLAALLEPEDTLEPLLAAPTEDDARAGEPDEDIDADFFAEAKKARRKK